MPGSEWPSVSVILPIRNETAYIERSLGAVLAQDYPADRLEILVVDGMSSDGTRHIVKRMLIGRARAHLLDNTRYIAAAALNVGLAAAQGEVIVRVDGHTIIAPDYVRRCVSALTTIGADCVGGPMRALGETPFGEAVALATSHPFGVGGARFHYATAAQEVDTVYLGTWRAERLRSLGFFHEDVGCNEDDELNSRIRAAGGRIWLDPTIDSVYYCRSTWRSLWRQYFRYGYWKVRALQKVPGSAQGRHWVPPLFALGLVSGALACLPFPVLRTAYLVGLGLYTLANLTASITLAAQAGWRHLLRLPLVFATLHLAYGFGFWAGVLRFGSPWKKATSDG